MLSRSRAAAPESSAPIEVGTVTALVRAAQQGDLKAFERLYRLHSPRVLGLCTRMVGDRDTAEDCVQRAFIKAWRYLGEFEGRSSFATWLHGIAVREVLSQRRTSSWLEFGADDLADTEAPSQSDAGAWTDIERAIALLPEGARYVIVLQAIYGYSHEEVAAMLGVAIGTCKAQLHRARALLKKRLNNEAAS